MKHFLRPRYFLLGFLFGFLLCCVLGYFASKHTRYHHFLRFTSYISPTIDYFPTASELLITAEHDVDPNKILVLIGGSSIMRGDGQNEDELWSQKLQNLLGNEFKVLNYGFNGAQFPSFGGVAFRMLRERFKKIIFVSTCTFAGEENSIDGGNIYGYLFWDAYYKHLFRPDNNEKQKIYTLRKNQLKTTTGMELHIMSYLDSLFYFRNLWNTISYKFFFTIYNKNTYPKIFNARRQFKDDVFDNKALADGLRKNKDHFKEEMHVFDIMDFHDLVTTQKHYTLQKATEISNTYNNVFEPFYRSKILCLLSTYNPLNLSALPTKDLQSYQIIMSDTDSILRSLGYNVIQTTSMVPEDYMDFMHYVASGGYKIADEMAPSIKHIAKLNGYSFLKKG